MLLKSAARESGGPVNFLDRVLGRGDEPDVRRCWIGGWALPSSGPEEVASEPGRWIAREETEASRPMTLTGGEQPGPGDARRFGSWELERP